MKVNKPRRKKTKKHGTPVYLTDGRVVGRVEGGVFRRVMRSTVHLLQRPRAWAADLDALDQARAAGASTVEILDRDTGATYRADLVDFYRRGVTVNRGHGPQLALPLACWQVTGGRASTRPGLDQSAAGPSQGRLL